MYYLANIFCTFGLLAFIALAVVKVFIHYVILKPLIEQKLIDTVEIPDPDFDWDKYIDWK